MSYNEIILELVTGMFLDRVLSVQLILYVGFSELVTIVISVQILSV